MQTIKLTKMKNIFLMLFAVLAISSCKKFLDVQPISESLSTNYYKTSKEAEGALAGAYDGLQPDSYYGFDMCTIGDAQSDDCTAGGDNPNNFQIDEFKCNSNNAIVTRFWRQLYFSIARANDVIDNVSTMDASLFVANRKNEIVAEARFLRALHYFNLVRVYGNIPLILQSVKAVTNDKINVPQANPNDIYTAIIADLDAAANNLGVNMEDGRATKGAAYGLLAKVYLTQKNYAMAATNAQKVNALSKYQIIGNYDDICTIEHNAEIMFNVEYTGGNEGSVLPDLLLPTPFATFQFLKFNTPTPSMINAYVAGDVRKATNIIFANQYYGNNFPHVFKWRNAAGFASPTNFVILRYADVKLIEAEALNETSYPSTVALNALNSIRIRAGLTGYTFAALSTKDLFRDAVLNERRLELAFEGHRWFDLLRTDRALSTLQSQYPSMNVNKLVLPIPQSELDLNKGLKQNLGYN
jgi:starch-binding outer membrane protein, SusD/RagB family